MATRSLFNHTTVTTEQNLIEDLIIESIQIYGIDMYYLPRTNTNLDGLFGEDAGTTKYNDAYPIELYVKNVDGFEGEGNFLQQFGVEIRDQITFTISKKRFGQLGTGLSRPKEGDLIWFPMTDSMYRIQFVEDESIFYQTGKLFVYDLQCELFEYAGEIFKTGVSDIDQYWLDITSGQQFDIVNGSGTFTVAETVYQGPTLSGATFTALVREHITESGIIDLVNLSNIPTSGVDLIGVDSGAQWEVLIDIDTVNDDTLQNIDDNELGSNFEIEEEGRELIDFSENNPFSEEW